MPEPKKLIEAIFFVKEISAESGKYSFNQFVGSGFITLNHK